MNFFFIFLFFVFPLLADSSQKETEENFIFPLAPLAPLSQEFPLGMNQKNRMQIMQGPKILEKEKAYNMHLIHSRSFPWKTVWILLSLALVGRFLYLFLQKQASYHPKEVFHPTIEALDSYPLKNKEDVLIFYEALLKTISIETKNGKNAIQDYLSHKINQIKYGGLKVEQQEVLNDYKQAKEWLIKKVSESSFSLNEEKNI